METFLCAVGRDKLNGAMVKDEVCAHRLLTHLRESGMRDVPNVKAWIETIDRRNAFQIYVRASKLQNTYMFLVFIHNFFHR